MIEQLINNREYMNYTLLCNLAYVLCSFAFQGGFVVNYHGTWRVQGSLAVSRGNGDGHLKQWVVADPETRTLLVDHQCELLILASDGQWGKIDNQDAVDLARPLCINDDTSSMHQCRDRAIAEVFKFLT
jgi:serine/threonine protein phosphatase PrpC